MRTAVCEPQLVEQLVEVPTLVSPSLPVDVKEEDTIVAVVSSSLGLWGLLPPGVHQARAILKYWPGLTWTSL